MYIENNRLTDIYFYDMDDTQKMLQVIIHGQNSLKQELVTKIDKVEKKLGGDIESIDQKLNTLEKKMDGVEKRLTKRIDKIGK